MNARFKQEIIPRTPPKATLKALLSIFIIGLISCLCLSLFVPLPVAEGSESIGKFTRVTGRVDVLRAGALPARSVKVDDPVYRKDVVRTKSNSLAEVLFANNNLIKIAQRSRIDIGEYFFDHSTQKGSIGLTRGMVRAVVDKENSKKINLAPGANSFEIHTQNAVAGVRGSDFTVFEQNGQTGILVYEGLIRAFNPFFRAVIEDIAPNQFTMIQRNRPVQPPQIASDFMKSRIEKNFNVPGKEIRRSAGLRGRYSSEIQQSGPGTPKRGRRCHFRSGCVHEALQSQ